MVGSSFGILPVEATRAAAPNLTGSRHLADTFDTPLAEPWPSR